MTKRHFAVTFACILFATTVVPSVAATTVSVQIVQVDKIHPDVTNSSLLVEESILDYLFSQGIIVSNSPIITSGGNSSTGYAIAMNDARSGSVDYLVYMTINFNTENSTVPDATVLENIEYSQWQLIRVSDSKQVASGKHVPKIRKESDNSSDGISSFGRQIAAAITSGLGRKI